jgi:glycosyltransferase involved in cell wall biosynthesis
VTKVLFVHDGHLYRDAHDNVYGAQYNDALVSRYASLGDQVTFILREKSIASEQVGKMDQIQSKNFTFIAIPNFKSITGFFKHRRTVRQTICVAVQSHDVIVARMPSQAAGIAIREAKRLNKPLLVELVACTFDAYWNHSWKGKLVAHYRFHAVKQIIRSCPYVMYVTQKFLQERYPTKGIQAGISDVELPVLDNRLLEKRLFKIRQRSENQPLVLGTVAALAVSYKRQADVIRAVARLKRNGIIFYYQLVGEGDPAALQKIINKEHVQNEVTILGTRKHHEVFEFLDGIDVYIQPSKQEGLPRALVEAISRACPALGSNLAGIPELLDVSCLFESGNIEELVSKLVNLNNEFLIKQAEQNFEKSKQYQNAVLNEIRKNFYNRFMKVKCVFTQEN